MSNHYISSPLPTHGWMKISIVLLIRGLFDHVSPSWSVQVG